MDRDRIKIVEFDKEDAADGTVREPRSTGPVGAGADMKIREFGAGSGTRPQPQPAPVPAAVQPSREAIRIVEFDKESVEAVADAAPPRAAPVRAIAPPAPGSIKIVEFDKRPAAAPGAPSRRAGIKIVEFD